VKQIVRKTVEYGAADPVGTAEFLTVGNNPDEFILRKGVPDKPHILRACYFICYKADILKSDIVSQAENAPCAVHGALARLDNDYHPVHAARRGTAEMFHTRLHIHHEGVVFVQDEIRNEGAHQYIFRTGAAAASAVNGAEDEERRTLMMVRKAVSNVGDVRIEFEYLPVLADFRSGSLLNQCCLTRYGDKLFLFGGGDSEGGRKIGVRVGVYCQDLPAAAGHEEDKSGGQRGFAGASFSRDSKFHKLTQNAKGDLKGKRQKAKRKF
jgi:hypothetical protein